MAMGCLDQPNSGGCPGQAKREVVALGMRAIGARMQGAGRTTGRDVTCLWRMWLERASRGQLASTVDRP